MTVVSEIIVEAGKLFSVHPRDILGPYKYPFLMPSRFAVYTALWRRGNGYKQAGRWVGGRDHSTVIHGIGRAEAWEAEDPDYAAKIQHLVDYRRPAVDVLQGTET